MNNQKFVIVCKPLEDGSDRFYIIRSNDSEDITLIGDVCISGSITAIANTLSEAKTIYKNIAY